MAKRGLIALGIVAVLAGGGFVAADWLLAKSATALLDKVQAGLPPDATFVHGKLSTSLWRREVALDNIDFKSSQASFKAQHAVLRGVPWLAQGRLSLGEIELDKASFDGDASASVDHLVLTRPTLFSGADPSQLTLSFVSAVLSGLTLHQKAVGFDLTVPDLTVGGFSDQRLSQLSARNLDANFLVDGLNAPASVHFDLLTLDSMDLGLLHASSPSDLLMRLLLQDSLRGLSLDGFSLKQQDKLGFSLEKLAFDGKQVAGAMRTALDFSVEGLKIARDTLPPELRSQLEALGQDALQMQFEFSSKLQQQDKLLVFQPVRLIMPGLIEVSVRGEFGNVQNTTQVGMVGATLRTVELHVKDLGLVRHRVESQAQMRGVSLADYVASEVSSMFPASDGNSLVLDRLRQAVSEFMLKSGEFVLIARPREPLPMVQMLFLLGQPETLAEKLDLFATVNAPSAAP